MIDSALSSLVEIVESEIRAIQDLVQSCILDALNDNARDIRRALFLNQFKELASNEVCRSGYPGLDQCENRLVKLSGESGGDWLIGNGLVREIHVESSREGKILSVVESRSNLT